MVGKNKKLLGEISEFDIYSPVKLTNEQDMSFIGLGYPIQSITNNSYVNYDNIGLMDTIEQEKAIKNYQIRAKENELENLKREQDFLTKQKIQMRKFYNALNKNESNISKLNLTRKSKVNFLSNNSDIEPMIKKSDYSEDELKMQDRANILYGNYDEYTAKDYQNEQSDNSSILLKGNVEYNEEYKPEISDSNKMFYSDGTLAEKPLKKEYKLSPITSDEIAKRHEKLEPVPEKHLPRNEVAVAYIHNPLVKSLGRHKTGIEAAENLHMSKSDYYLNTDYAKKHLVFNNYLEVNSNLHQYLKDKISQQIGPDKLLTTKGIYIDSDSDSSKRLARVLLNHNDFIKLLIDNHQALKKGLHINASMQFLDRNFHYALGNADLLDIHFNKFGQLELLVADTYDFNKNETKDLIVTARRYQDQGKITPYFIIYHVVIPKNVKI